MKSFFNTSFTPSRLLGIVALISVVCSSSAFVFYTRYTNSRTLPNSGVAVFAGDSDDGQEISTATAEEGGQEIFIPLLYRRNFGSSTGVGWVMAGGNPERTSWTPEEVRGNLKPYWYRPLESYILPRVQVIAEYGNLYISTANGLYALDAKTGAEKWVYPTELPLGHSPTVSNGRLYVGGFDHKLHVIDAYTGKGLWTFAAEKGFDTNPLVVNGIVYAGNRDGYFYAVYAEGERTGQLAWKYKTAGPIHFSAAYKDGVVFFASDDSHAYALNARTGNLEWKSKKLPGSGFHSWWPVVYRDWVIFAGSNNYRFGVDRQVRNFIDLEETDLFPNQEADPRGTLISPMGQAPGDWVAGTLTLDMSRPNVTPNGSTLAPTEYLESKPWRRTYFVLNRATGEEYTTDFDKDGKPEYAPILWLGTHGGGNRYPPVVGSDGVLYQGNKYRSDPTIPAGHISGWQIGTPFISIVNNSWNATDEPVAYAAGGNLIYWNRCCDRVGGAFDITIPESDFEIRTTANERNSSSNVDRERKWNYFSYDLPERIPGYNLFAYVYENYAAPYGSVFGDRSGSYGWHGDVNPPIPYQGMVYMHRSNAIIAFGVEKKTPAGLPPSKRIEVSNADINLSEQQLKDLLVDQVEKVLSAGHLKPGYLSSGITDQRLNGSCGDYLADYWHNPSDVLYTLIRALPHLPENVRGRVRLYLQSEFNAYPPTKLAHIGWKDGAARDVFDLPPEVVASMSSFGPSNEVRNFDGWKFPPFNFYALWKYAQIFGNARAIFDASQNNLAPLPDETVLIEYPQIHNAYIVGYLGYLELQKLAGYPASQNVVASLEYLKKLRMAHFTIEPPNSYFENSQRRYCRALNTSRNFMYLVPELAGFFRENKKSDVQSAIDHFTKITPYWFVSKAETSFGEGITNHAYDYYTIFQAKALILEEPRGELVKYLDVPAFQVGDFFYIQNLIALLEARSS